MIRRHIRTAILAKAIVLFAGSTACVHRREMFYPNRSAPRVTARTDEDGVHVTAPYTDVNVTKPPPRTSAKVPETD
jgi:hypothetical protein